MDRLASEEACKNGAIATLRISRVVSPLSMHFDSLEQLEAPSGSKVISTRSGTYCSKRDDGPPKRLFAHMAPSKSSQGKGSRRKLGNFTSQAAYSRSDTKNQQESLALWFISRYFSRPCLPGGAIFL
jgi:hypothetical protein